MNQGETKKILYYEAFSTMTCPMPIPKRHKVAGAPFLPSVRTDQHELGQMQRYVGGYLGSSIASHDASNFAFARDPNVLTTDSTHQTNTVASHLPGAAQQQPPSTAQQQPTGTAQQQQPSCTAQQQPGIAQHHPPSTSPQQPGRAQQQPEVAFANLQDGLKILGTFGQKQPRSKLKCLSCKHCTMPHLKKPCMYRRGIEAIGTIGKAGAFKDAKCLLP